MKKVEEFDGIGKFVSFFERFFKKIDELEILPSEILNDLKFLNCDYINNCLNPLDITANVDILFDDCFLDDLPEEV